MVAVRSLVYLVYLFGVTVAFSIPLSIFGWFASESMLGAIGRYWGRICIGGLGVICGLRYRVQGAENVPGTACVVLSKHQSAWETIALRVLLPPRHTWVLKRELLSVPFFGWGIAPYRPIAIDRKAGRRAVRQLLEEGQKALDSGRQVVIFPEGTRVAPGERKRYGMGGALLAERSGYPVVPIAHNAGVFWRRRGLRKYPGTIDVVIGEPFSTEGMSAAQINARVEEWIESTVQGLPQARA
jgi:1-acyl-sn-glycerol-3-phosphate acyltransferase